MLCEQPVLLSYILTYKFSQDHLELFFGAVRARGGWNNNPTAAQFISTFKRLMQHHEIKCISGNVSAQDGTKVLHLTKGDRIKNGSDIYDVALEKLYDLKERSPMESEHDYCDVSNIIHLSEFIENIVTYIAGFVVRMARKILTCNKCYAALISADSTQPPCFDLLLRKTRGGLIIPSQSTVLVCRKTEQCVRRLLNSNSGKVPLCNISKLELSICNVVLSEIGMTNMFPSLSDHMLDTTPDSNHVFRLINIVTKCYLKIRLHHLCKTQSEEMKGTLIRKKLSKLILFNNQ